MKKYKYVTIHNHPLFPGKTLVQEHRLVMAEYLGRPLLKTEDVHHKDENRANNRIGNLEIKIHQRHSAYHRIGKHLTIETKRKISLAKKGNPGPWLGKHFTAEHKRKLSLAKIGKPSPRGFKGKCHTVESKKKMSVARKKYWLQWRYSGV